MLNVADFVKPNTGKDVSDALQSVIDTHPNHTLYFPDGEYLLSKPLTTPAHHEKSVSLKLADFAVLRASEDFCSEEAVLRLGATEPENNATVSGSNYGLEGGVIDAMGKTTGLSIDGGRETYVRGTSIKNARIGLHIKPGANSGSADADVFGVNITGTGEYGCTGVLIEANDNPLSNMRLGKVFIGVKLTGNGNMLRNLHPLFNRMSEEAIAHYAESVGFQNDAPWGNFFDFCYADHFATGFYTDSYAVYQNCWAYWYRGTEKEARHVGWASSRPFEGRINTGTVSGHEHPDHPIRFFDVPSFHKRAYLANLVLGEDPYENVLT